MTDHDALLRAVCEHPREDTPRLVYADWLQEHGQDERAEFIRRDIAMSHRDEWDADRLRWEEANRRLKGVLAWFGLWPDPSHRAFCWHDAPFHGGGFSRRGFPWAVQVTGLGVFRARAADLFARHPVEYLSFRVNLPQLTRLVSELWFPRVSGLEWGAGRYSARGLAPLLDSPAGVTDLGVHGLALSPDGGRALVRSPLFANLVRLRLGWVPSVVGLPVLGALGPGPAPGRLRALAVRAEWVGGDAGQLARSLPAGLRSLDLAHSRLNAAAAAGLAAVGTTSGLRVLTLTSNGVGNAGAAALFTSPHLAGLKVLNLSYCQVGDDALRALLDASPLADGLNLLDLTGSPASADMKQAVKDRMGDRVRL
jgi:uncharacterized protein (TIGR02996 family)